MASCQISFLSNLGSLKFSVKPTVVFHGYGWSNWECEGWFSFGITYADNLVLCCESVEKVMARYEEWKEALEGKGLREKRKRDREREVFLTALHLKGWR